MKYIILALLTVSEVAMAGFYDYKATSLDGQNVDLGQYKGKVALVVNTASKCGYTPQYKNLQALYDKYQSQGLVVLGFPSNDFMGQEPGTATEIKKFCELNYGVKFPLFAKNPVSGSAKQEIFKYLTESAPEKGEVKWNFEKFLIGPQGEVVARYRSGVKPDSPEVTAQIEKLLVKR